MKKKDEMFQEGHNLKVLFLIPDSFGVRNYLYSDLLDHLKESGKVVLWSSLPSNAFDELRNKVSIELEYKQFTFPKESWRGRFFRESATYARLIKNSITVNNKTILLNWNYRPKGLKKKILNFLAQGFGKAASKNYRIILGLEKRARGAWSRRVIDFYKEELEKSGVKRIFITHQRVSELMPICLAAKESGVKVFSVVYSWDNLPKARLNILADYYLVWSDYMRNEMIQYYPEIDRYKILVTGTPQFEFYSKPNNIIKREQFAQQFGLDLSKKWFLYSGGDELTSPFDQMYLADLLQEIELRADVQIILRRSPADFSLRYDSLIKEFPDKLAVIDPIWRIGRTWSENIPQISDFKLLASLAAHCVAAINVGSTVAHDFANFDKPTLYVNYDAVNSPNWKIADINGFQHFKSMPSRDCVVWVNRKTDWTLALDSVIYRADSVAKDRLKWYRVINENLEISPSKKIAQVLLNY